MDIYNNMNIFYNYMSSYAFIEFIGYVQIFQYLYLGILTIICVGMIIRTRNYITLIL